MEYSAYRRRLVAPKVLSVLVVLVCLVMAWIQGYRASHNDGVDLNIYAQFGEAILHGGFMRDPGVNTGPPFFSLLVVPVSLLYRAVASGVARQALVYGINLTLSVACLVLAFRAQSGERRIRPAAVALAWLCAYYALNENFTVHQINLFPLLLCVIAFTRLGRSADDPLAGGLLGLAASVKAAPVFLLLYLVGRWRALSAAIAAGVACAVAPALVYGPRQLIEAWKMWLLESIPIQGGARTVKNVSLPGAMHRLFDASGKEPIPGFRPLIADLGHAAADRIGVFMGLLLLALLVAVIRRGRPRPPMVDLGLLGPAAVLTGTLAWPHHFVVLLPTMSALVLYLSHPSGERWRRRLASALLGVSVAGLTLTVFAFVPSLKRLSLVLQAADLVTVCVILAVGALVCARGDPLTEAFGGACPPELTPAPAPRTAPSP